MKKGLFKQLTAKATKVESYEHLKGWGKIRYNKRTAKPLRFSVDINAGQVKINSVMSMDHCGHKVEDPTLVQAKKEMAKRAVQLYNKGPYGLLTPQLAKEMANGENRRRS